jgi:uncharacterized protein (TIGR02757 family)
MPAHDRSVWMIGGQSLLRERLERLRRRYHDRRFVDSDPLVFLYDYEAVVDREVAGLVASALAYGNVTAMLPAIRRVLEALGPAPSAALARAGAMALRRRFRGFRYRFTTGAQVAGLLAAAARVQREHRSIDSAVAAARADGGVAALGALADVLRASTPVALGQLVPHPDDGSACKRMCLYLRWMVRRDAIDPGGWTSLRADELIVPLDVHVFRAARRLGWTKRRTPNLRAAEEVTAALAAIAPGDPLRYDFAITRPGILKEVAPEIG